MLKKFDNAFMKFTEYVLSFSVIAMAAILIAGVIARSVFNSSLTFTEEVGQILNITVTFFAVGYCAKMARGNCRSDFIGRYFRYSSCC